MVGVISHWDILAHPVAPFAVSDGSLLPADWSLATQTISFAPAGRWLSWGPPPRPCHHSRTLHRPGVAGKANLQSLRDGLCRRRFGGAVLRRLGDQEQYHADLLEICRAAAIRRGWKANLFNPWTTTCRDLNDKWRRPKPRCRKLIPSRPPCIGRPDRIRGINQVFCAALAATDSAFVKKLRPFQAAMEAHMAYIVERIPELSPRLLLAARELRPGFRGCGARRRAKAADSGRFAIFLTQEHGGNVWACLKSFKDFAVKGNAIDMAIGIVIGAAFGKIVRRGQRHASCRRWGCCWKGGFFHPGDPPE